MQIGWSTLAFASGTVATTVVAVSVMSLNSQQVRDNAFHVCVAKDRVLRLVETDEPCPEGQERLRLAEAGTPDVEPPKDTDDKPAKKPETSKPISSKVQAPFEVVDYHGRTIVRVDTGFGDGTVSGMGVYSPDGRLVALVVADHGHGVVRAQSSDGKMSTSFGASTGFAGLRVREGEKVRAELGRGEAGGYGTRIYGSGQTPMAFLGLTASGIPTVLVGNGTNSLAYLGVTNQNRGIVGVTNSSGSEVASLSEGGDGGKLQLLDQGGTTVVEAGVLPGGAGVVRAGPSAFADRAGLVRLSELRGKR